MPDGSPLEAWAATVRALLCREGVEQMQIDAELALSLPARYEPMAPRLRAHARDGDAVLGRDRPSGGHPGSGCGGGRRRRSDLGGRGRALRAGAPGAGARRSRGSRVGACPGQRLRRGRAADGLRRDRDPAGRHGEAGDREAAGRAGPNDARGRASHTSADDARAALVLGACAARARESTPGLVGRKRRGDALPRGGRDPSPTTCARHARGRSRQTSERGSRRSPTHRRAGRQR